MVHRREPIVIAASGSMPDDEVDAVCHTIGDVTSSTAAMSPAIAPRNSRAASHATPAAVSSIAAILGELSQDEALQVVGFRHAEQHRMIASLHPLLDDRDVRLRVDRGVVDDLGERRLVDVVRAAAGDERAARVRAASARAG